MINDAHCHFFSTTFFETLARQLQRPLVPSAEDVCHELQWDAPGDASSLALRWVRELDASGVGRAVLIASVPGDEASVAQAVAHAPGRFVGFFMVDAAKPDAPERTHHAIETMGLRGVCLFPAMHHVPLDDERVERIVSVAAQHAGTAVFVHCGTLSVGVRKKLGLASPFNLQLGDPLAVARLAARHPGTPFIIPHFGAGLLNEVLVAASDCRNIYLDTSSSNGWINEHAGLTLETVFQRALDAAGPMRLLFGTDSSFFPRGWQRPIYEAQQQALTVIGLKATDRALIFGGNFDRLFG